MQDLKELHPAVAVTFIVCISAVACVLIWQIWKTIRES